MRDLVVIALVGLLSAVGLLYWLHDGDLAEAIEPVVDPWKGPG
jgi:hypothetical protein